MISVIYSSFFSHLVHFDIFLWYLYTEHIFSLEVHLDRWYFGENVIFGLALLTLCFCRMYISHIFEQKLLGIDYFQELAEKNKKWKVI